MNIRACVRCGVEPRADETFLCLTCLDLPSTRREMQEARVKVDSGIAQRAWLTEKRGWVGGWSIRRGSVRA